MERVSSSGGKGGSAKAPGLEVTCSCGLQVLILLVLIAVLSVAWAYASPRGGQQHVTQVPLQIVIQTGRGLYLVHPGVWVNEVHPRSVRVPNNNVKGIV